MIFFKGISLGSCTYLVAFMVDYVVELFRINSSGEKITFLGLKIVTSMRENSLNTTFSLTWKVLITYAVFMVVFMLIFSAFRKIKSR